MWKKSVSPTNDYIPSSKCPFKLYVKDINRDGLSVLLILYDRFICIFCICIYNVRLEDWEAPSATGGNLDLFSQTKLNEPV